MTILSMFHAALLFAGLAILLYLIQVLFDRLDKGKK